MIESQSADYLKNIQLHRKCIKVKLNGIRTFSYSCPMQLFFIFLKSIFSLNTTILYHMELFIFKKSDDIIFPAMVCCYIKKVSGCLNKNKLRLTIVSHH